MLRLVLYEQKKIKNILLLVFTFIALLGLYIFLDNFGHQSYSTLADAFGVSVLIQTLVLNVLISLISAVTISFTIINYKLNNSMTSGSFFASIGNLFAVIFTGCATCGLSVFGALGISLGLPAITPGAVKYKFFALLVIILGLIVVTYIINTSVCSIKKRR